MKRTEQKCTISPGGKEQDMDLIAPGAGTGVMKHDSPALTSHAELLTQAKI